MPKGQFKNPKERAAKIAESNRTGQYFNCLVCGAEFWRKQSAIKKGQNKFCSKRCYFVWQKGRKRSNSFRAKCRKGQSQRYIGQIMVTSKNKRIRGSEEYKQWRTSVFKRDNWTCQECGARSKKNCYIRIEAHHKKPFATFPELRFVISNGQTLCKECHSKEPKGKEVYCIK